MDSRAIKVPQGLIASGVVSLGLSVVFAIPVLAQGRCDPASVGASVAGSVVDADSEVPLPGARVVVRWGDTSRETLAGVDGGFVVCELPRDADVEVQAFVATLAGPVVRVGRERPADLELAIGLTGAGTSEGSLEITRGGEAMTGRITGRVLDQASGAPIAGAVVGVRGRSALSSESGAFVIDDVPPGLASLTVEHIGYGTLADTLTLFGQATVDVTVRLGTDPVEVEPITVTVEQVRDRRLETKGFYRRQQWGEAVGTGDYFTREDIERRNPQTITQLVADVPGVRLDCRGGIGMRSCELVSKHAWGFSCRSMTVYVDGIRAIAGDRPAPQSLDSIVLPVEVAAVEVYPSAASIPADFGGASGAQCGVVAIWTRTR